ncbi:MAG: hypothetical protein ACI8ZM_003524 [Crocinitomix sp.]|jgi:hypothetical protein
MNAIKGLVFNVLIDRKRLLSKVIITGEMQSEFLETKSDSSFS